MKIKLYFSLYCLLICLVIILADMDRLPLDMLSLIPHYDWIAHMILYGMFCGLLNSFLGGRKYYLFQWDIPTAFLLTVLFLTMEEVSQIFLVSRTFSFMDLFMGFLGAFLFALTRSSAVKSFCVSRLNENRKIPEERKR